MILDILNIGSKVIDKIWPDKDEAEKATSIRTSQCFTTAGTGLWLTPMSASLSGLAAAVLIGTGKEAIWDNWLKKGTDDKYDMYATATGGAFGALVLWGFLIYD